MFCSFSIFAFPYIRPPISEFCLKGLRRLIDIDQYPDFDPVFKTYPLFVTLIICNLIVTVFYDLCLLVKEYFKQEKKIVVNKLDYKQSSEVYIFFMQDVDVWAKKNKSYDRVPETDWEKIRVKKKGLNFEKRDYENIPLSSLKIRFYQIELVSKLSIKAIELLENNNSNNILKKCYYKVKNFIIKNYIKFK